MLGEATDTLDNYRQQLRASLEARRPQPTGYARPSLDQASGEGPLDTAEGDLGDARAEDPTFRQTGGLPGDHGQAPDPYSPPVGAPGTPPSTDLNAAVGQKKTATGAQKEQAGPPKDLKYDKKKLDSAKTVADHVMAMKPSSADRFMSWWEDEHGSINKAYDNVKEQLGHPPEPNRLLSRKDKFAALMDFGVNLIKASEGGAKNPIAAATGATVQGLEAKDKQATDEFQGKSLAIEKGRNDALKTLGNRGTALKGAADIDMREAQQAAENAKRVKAENAAPETLYSDQGVHSWDAKTHTYKPVLGADGKPLTNMKVGGRGGERDTRTAVQKDYEFWKSKNLTDDAARILATHEKTGDPRKDYLSVYNRALTANYGDAEKAKKTAKEVIGEIYPEGTNVRLDGPQPIPPKGTTSNDPFGIRTK